MERNSKGKPLIIVISRIPLVGLSTVRALGKAGYTVDLISSTHRAGGSALAKGSRYVRKHTEIVHKKKKDFRNSEIIDVIKGYKEERQHDQIVLYPADDYTVALIEENRSELCNDFVIPFIARKEKNSVADTLTYEFQNDIADKIGFNENKKWIVDLKHINIPEDIVYPCICKPCDYLTESSGERTVLNDVTELKLHLNMLRRRNDDRCAVIYGISKSMKELEFNGFCFNGKVNIPAAVQYTEYAQYNGTVPIKGKITSVDEFNDAYLKSIELIQRFDFNGIFNISLLVDDNNLYFCQLQLSSGQSNHALCECGINLHAEFISAALKENELTTKNLVFDRKVLFDNAVDEDYRRDLLTKKQKRSMISGADIKIIRDNEDPYPGKLSNRKSENRTGYENLTLKRKVKFLIKKYIFPILSPIKQLVRQYPQLDPANERKSESEKPRVIVSGRNYGSNLCIARAIGKAGYEVEVLRIFHRKPKMRQLLKKLIPDAYSKYIKAFWTCTYGGKSLRVVNKLISLADPDRKILIVPADDLVACIIDDYYYELGRHFVLPNVSEKSGEINRLMSKSVQKELAIKAGLPVVKSCIIKTEAGKFDIPDTVDYPCFIKPNISKNGSKTKMRRCDSRQELWNAIAELAEVKDVEMLVEDFIEIGKEYSVLGVSTKNGAIGPGFFGAEEGGQVEHRGVAVTGKVLPCNFTPQWEKLINDTVKFVGSLDFDGLYDVDFIETVDGKLYFVEVNMRFGGSGYAITESGLNLPGMFADYMLLGEPIDMGCSLKKTGKRFVSEKVLIEEYVKNRITMSRLNEIMDDVDIHFIKDDKDPAAFRHFKKFYIIAALYRLVYKIKDISDSEFGK